MKLEHILTSKSSIKVFLTKHLNFNSKIFTTAFFVFPLIVVFGTLSHESGHIIVAKILGFETTLHYGSMSWFSNGQDGNLVESDFTILLITLGGVLQTIFVGTLGLLLMQFKNKKIIFWIGIYLTLFWSRQIINLLIGLINGLFFKNPFFGGDELIISSILGLPNGFFSIILGLLGFIICLYAILKIKIENRLSFLTAGLISGVLSFLIWFSYLGKLILP